MMIEVLHWLRLMGAGVHWPTLDQLVVLMSLVLIIDHGLRHLRDRLREWKGCWYRTIGIAILMTALICYVVHVSGYLNSHPVSADVANVQSDPKTCNVASNK